MIVIRVVISADGWVRNFAVPAWALTGRIVKAETGARPPSEDVAPKIAEMFPGLCNGLYVRLAAIARKSNGPNPGWFADWLGREREAASARIWQPIIVPGLLLEPRG
jgi:hypothetical protein